MLPARQCARVPAHDRFSSEHDSKFNSKVKVLTMVCRLTCVTPEGNPAMMQVSLCSVMMQCLPVGCALRCQADSEPEFRYIMPLAAETHSWADKLLRWIQTFTHIRTPEFRYIMPCSADVDKLSCSLFSYANLGVLVSF